MPGSTRLFLARRNYARAGMETTERPLKRGAEYGLGETMWKKILVLELLVSISLAHIIAPQKWHFMLISP